MGGWQALSIHYNNSKVGNLRKPYISLLYYFCNAGDTGATFKLSPQGFQNQIGGYHQSGAFFLQFINCSSDIAI